MREEHVVFHYLNETFVKSSCFYNTIRKLLSFFDFYHTRQITKQLTPTKNMFVLTVNRPHWHSVPNSGTKLVLYSF